MTAETAIQALVNIPPRLSLRDRARIRAEHPIAPPTKERIRHDLLRPSHLDHGFPYRDRFGPHVTAMRQWVDRALSGPIGEMPYESERAAAAEWLMEPYSEPQDKLDREAWVREMNARDRWPK